MDTTLRDRIAGSLYGLLVGDAFGCPVEGWSQQQIARTYGRLTEMEEPRGRWRPRGLHSDDGQQALAICDAVLEDPAHPGPGFARRAVDLLRLGPRGAGFGLHRGTGGNFRRSVKALAQGAPWDQAASVTAGNGAAMRIAPVALYHRDDPRSLLDSVVDVSRVTHRDIRGVAAAGAVAWMAARALTHTGPARELGDDALLAFVRDVEDRCAALFATQDHLHDFSDGVARVLGSLDEPRPAALQRIEALAQTTAARRAGATSGFALGSVLTSLYMFLTSRDYEQALIETVMLGGDADTTGAMVGQMCGALYGEAAIPERWRRALLASGALEDRIDALTSRQAGFLPAVPVVELERPWTQLYLGGPGGG
jgi:ADP-ribosyl-[dinitrogen reductase] hydrolase